MSEFKKGQQWRRHHQWGDVAERIVDGEGNTFHRQFVQNVEPVINHNKEVLNDSNGWLPDRSARKVGSIPVTIVHDKIRQWEKEGRLSKTDPHYSLRLNELLKSLLRDRDYSKFRTTEHV